MATATKVKTNKPAKPTVDEAIAAVTAATKARIVASERLTAAANALERAEQEYRKANLALSRARRALTEALASQ